MVIVGGAAALVAVGWTGASTFESSCSLSSLRPVRIGQNSFVYAADGTLLGAIPAEKNREPLSLSRMSSWLGRATVAIEDRRFYEHGGLDFASIVRAAVRNTPFIDKKRYFCLGCRRADLDFLAGLCVKLSS